MTRKLTPHPIFQGLLGDKEIEAANRAEAASSASTRAIGARAVAEKAPGDKKADLDKTAKKAEDEAAEAEKAVDFPFVDEWIKGIGVLRAGFIVGQIERDGRKWLVVFESWGAGAWMLVPRDAIPDEGIKYSDSEWTADAIWINRDATVYIGRERPRSVERMFLDGSLTVAGDLEQTLGSRGGRTVGLFSPESPPLCGCGKKTN